MKYTEPDIVYETDHFFVLRINQNEYEICCNGITCADVLGYVASIEHAKRFIDRVEMHHANFRRYNPEIKQC